MNLSSSWAYIEKIAAERLEHNKTPRHVSVYGTDIEVLGVAGELAARLYFGLEPVLHTHFDGGSDFSLGPYTVDVKTTQLTPNLAFRFLQWPLWKPVKADFILMVGVDLRSRTAALLGYVPRHEVLAAPANLDRRFPCREISVRALRPVWELVARQVHGERLNL